MAATPLVVNGVITDWSRTELSIAKKKQGSPAMPPIRGGFTKLDFDYGIEGRENQLGNSPEPVGQNEGNMTYNATAEMFEAAWKKWLKYLGKGFMSVENPLTLSVVYKVDGKTHRVSIQGSLTKRAGSWSQGSVHMCAVDFKPTSIRETDEDGNLVEPIG